jgi:hypothetical protein
MYGCIGTGNMGEKLGKGRGQNKGIIQDSRLHLQHSTINFIELSSKELIIRGGYLAIYLIYIYI